MILYSALCALLAVATILTAGYSLQRILAPPPDIGPAFEQFGLAWVLGGGWVSIMLPILGSLTRRFSLFVAVLVSIGVLVLVASKLRRKETHTFKKLSTFEWLLVGVLLAEFGVIVFLANQFPLGWDAAMNWEWKARLAFNHGGPLPLKYFSNPAYAWSLPRYPLQLPYVEAWLYLWLGHWDQSWVQIIGPLYYLAGTAILAGACQRLAGSRSVGLCAGAALFFVPYTISGTWGIFAGYADFPLGVLLMAAVSRIPSLAAKPNESSARLLGVLAALLPWMKREGQYLWFIIMLLAVIQLWRARKWKLLPWVAAPGIVMIGAIGIAMALLQATPNPDSFPLTMDHLVHRWHRIGYVAGWLGQEMLDFESWSLLWPGTAIALIALGFRRRWMLASTLGSALVLCWGLVELACVVGYPDPQQLERILSVSFLRIILQFAPLAMLTIAVAVPRRAEVSYEN
jgi:hypothetical protein